MKKVVLIQLPIPQLGFGLKTGNIPLGAACLKKAAADLPCQIDIIPESFVSYASDSAILDLIKEQKPDIVGFTVFSWNADRSMYMAENLKQAIGSKIIFGGPEITPDNGRIRKNTADFLVHGEGEALFVRLLSEESIWARGSGSECSGKIFEMAESPYLGDLLEPGIEDMMLLETQRGCPYKCGYCYYSKSRKKIAFAGYENLVKGFEWAMERNLSEVFLLDPSLDSRRNLFDLLKIFSEINIEQRIRICSEIRAEMITPELADLLEKSGFSGFEMGLQTINSEPLRIMNRKTDLGRFVHGVNLVKERGITPSIDLIIGLPGDTPDGFIRSVDFVEEHGFHDDIQVFPLSVLPGTDFRSRSIELGLSYEPDPPYTIKSTPTFTEEDLMASLSYAEDRFDVAIYPYPDLDASWHVGRRAVADHCVFVGEKKLVRKVMLNDGRSLDDIEKIAGRLTHPYQIFVMPGMKNRDKIMKSVSILTSRNPFTPLEIVFISPDYVPDTNDLLEACNLKRPNFLDNDLRFLYPDSGNRAFILTIVSSCMSGSYEFDMSRHVYLWNNERLPVLDDFERLSDYDGILIDSDIPRDAVEKWQERFFETAMDIPEVTFSDIGLQKRWLLMTKSKNYSAYVLEKMF